MVVGRQQRVTIKDIARVCKVSTQTVSRVLNNRADVAAETRLAIEQSIAELGYQPSALARGLVQQRSYTLGVIIAGLNYAGVSLTLNGITEQCEVAKYSLLLKELPDFKVMDIAPIIRSLIASDVEGIIFAAPEIGNNIQIVQSQLPNFCPPIVFLKSQPNGQHITIGVDNYAGARQATEHLIQVGRKQIAAITGPLDWLEARQRWQGWSDALTGSGEVVTAQRWVSGKWSSQSGEAAFAELIQKYPPVDAVFAGNDQMALGVLHYASTHAIRVPEDLAVVGFDDLPEAAYFTPALTSVKHPLRELGIAAVRTLLAYIEDPQPESRTALTLQTELVIRASTPHCKPESGDAPTGPN